MIFLQGETLVNFDLAQVQKLQQQYLTNLQQIFTTIRQHNQQATVFILGLYNPFIELEDSQRQRPLFAIGIMRQKR